MDDHLARRPLRVLYISYDGMAEPLGQSQVLPYLRALAERGHSFELVSFEKPGTPTAWRKPVHPRIRWTSLRYHKQPTVPATAVDVGFGAAAAVFARLAARVDLVHVRSYVPGVMAAPAVALTRTRWIFDMRGFWADEKVDTETWPATGGLYKGARWVERRLLRSASAVTVLTHSALGYLRNDYPFRREITAPVWVIPTCVDLDRFNPNLQPDSELASRVAGAAVLGSVGSLAGRYLIKQMAHFYLAFRRYAKAPTRLLVLTRDDVSELRDELAAHGAGGELLACELPPHRMPAAIRVLDACIFLYKPLPSARGCAPTKLGELLASGIPVVGNSIGDVAQVLRNTQAGILLDHPDDPEQLVRAAQELTELLDCPSRQARCRNVGGHPS